MLARERRRNKFLEEAASYYQSANVEEKSNIFHKLAREGTSHRLYLDIIKSKPELEDNDDFKESSVYPEEIFIYLLQNKLISKDTHIKWIGSIIDLAITKDWRELTEYLLNQFKTEELPYPNIQAGSIRYIEMLDLLKKYNINYDVNSPFQDLSGPRPLGHENLLTQEMQFGNYDKVKKLVEEYKADVNLNLRRMYEYRGGGDEQPITPLTKLLQRIFKSGNEFEEGDRLSNEYKNMIEYIAFRGAKFDSEAKDNAQWRYKVSAEDLRYLRTKKDSPANSIVEDIFDAIKSGEQQVLKQHQEKVRSGMQTDDLQSAHQFFRSPHLINIASEYTSPSETDSPENAADSKTKKDSNQQ